MARLVVLLCFGCGFAALAADVEKPAAATQPVTKTFRVETADDKTKRLEVKEAGYELIWHETKTRFYLHRSVPLKDVKDGVAVHVLGKLHEPRDDSTGKTGKRTDRMLTNIEHIGVGAAYVEPPLTSEVAGVAWVKGSLATRQHRVFETGGERYRMVVDDKTLAYSLERSKPDALKGVKVIVRANPRKVTIEQGGKEVEVTRLHLLEVHVVELSPEHAKLFQAQWVDRKKPAAAAAGPAKKR